MLYIPTLDHSKINRINTRIYSTAKVLSSNSIEISRAKKAQLYDYSQCQFVTHTNHLVLISCLPVDYIDGVIFPGPSPSEF